MPTSVYICSIFWRKFVFAELVDNHVRMGKGEERRKEEEGKEGEKEKLSLDLHSFH